MSDLQFLFSLPGLLTIAFMGLVIWGMNKFLKKPSKAMKALGDIETVSTKDLALAWTKSYIITFPSQFWFILSMIAGMGLLFGAIAIDGIFALVGAVAFFVWIFVWLMVAPKPLKVTSLNRDRYEELRDYVKANKAELVQLSLESEEVIAGLKKMPEFLRTNALKSAMKARNYPKQGQYD